MREIVPGILTWPSYSARFGYDFNGFLVRRPDGNLAIDPVEPDRRRSRRPRARRRRAHPRSPTATTTAPPRALRERTGARVAVHPADAAFVREKGVTVDDALAVGDRVGPFVVVAGPGKSPGEVALHWPDASASSSSATPASARRPGGLSLLPPAVIDAPDGCASRSRRLAAELDFDTLLVADGEPILRGGRAALQRLVATFDGSAPTPVAMPRQP